jgi:hypothetical protein
MEKLNYLDLKKEYKRMEAQERVNNKFSQGNNKEGINLKDDKQSNLETKQEFWEYLNSCPIRN